MQASISHTNVMCTNKPTCAFVLQERVQSKISAPDLRPSPFVPQEILKKRRFGRLQKVMGDYSLLAGSPVDATDHYQTAADLARASSDFIWAGAALEGLAHAQVSQLAGM